MPNYVNFYDDDDDEFDGELLPIEKLPPPKQINPYIQQSHDEILNRLPTLVAKSIDVLESTLTGYTERSDKLKAVNTILRLTENLIKLQQK